MELERMAPRHTMKFAVALIVLHFVAACLACGGRLGALAEKGGSLALDASPSDPFAEPEAGPAPDSATPGDRDVSDASVGRMPPADSSAPPQERDDASSASPPVDATAEDTPSDAVGDATDLPDVVCEGGPPVAACIQYFVLVQACYHRADALMFACQLPLLATPDANVAAIELMCDDSIAQLRLVCPP
jgi:hypothetical protein